MKLVRDEKYHGLRTQRITTNKWAVSDDIGLRGPSFRNISGVKCYLYGSTRRNVYPYLTASPKVHTKRCLTLCHACVSCTLGENTPQFRLHFRGHSEAYCAVFCSPEAQDDPTLQGVDDDGNECFLWNSSMADNSNSWVHGMPAPRIA